MAAGLSDEQNEYAREVLRELLAQFKERGEGQKELGQALGLDQSAISALTKHNATRGTTPAILIAAAKLAGRSPAEVSRALGVRDAARFDANAGPPDPFETGAHAAILDGASPADVEAVRRRHGAVVATWTWAQTRDAVLAAKAVRLETATPTKVTDFAAAKSKRAEQASKKMVETFEQLGANLHGEMAADPEVPGKAPTKTPRKR